MTRHWKPRPGYHDRVRTEILPLVPLGGGTLLDIGGGTGATALWLRKHGLASRVGVVDRIAPLGGPRLLDFRETGDIEDPHVLARTFARTGPVQTILCLDVLEQLRDPWSIVRRLHRGLAPGGSIIASISNVRHYQTVLPLLLRNRWTLTEDGPLDRMHLRFFVRPTAIGLMTCSGLALDRIVPVPSGGPRTRRFRMMTLGLLNSFTDRRYLIRVRRTDGMPDRKEPTEDPVSAEPSE